MVNIGGLRNWSPYATDELCLLTFLDLSATINRK